MNDESDRLAGVWWIGGGSGAGKSTLARRLAAELDVPVYGTDDVMTEHARRLPPDRAPLLYGFLGMTMDERWVERDPHTMLDTFHWFAGEGFELILNDLRERRARTGIVVEGFRLLPRLVAPLLAERRAAVWLLPTPAFRHRAFEQRGSLHAIAGRTSNPDRALANLLERDRLFTYRLRAEVADLGLASIELDVGSDEDVVLDRLRRSLGLDRSGDGPGAF